MPSCEKCWRQAGGNPEEYHRLVYLRNEQGKECTPEEQAGPSATICPKCNRRTVHQFAERCVICGQRKGWTA